MINGAMAAGAGGAIGAMAEALKAIGPVVFLDGDEFVCLLERMEKPLVVQSPSGFMTKYKYLTGYRGLVFFAKSKFPLMLPSAAEIITAKKIGVPEL